MACEASLATLGLLEAGLMTNAVKMGNRLLGQLKKVQKNYAIIGDVRGKGLMIGVELVKNRRTREPEVVATNKIVQDAFRKGLLLLPCGDSVIRFAPPLVIDSDQVDRAVDIFSEVLTSYTMEKAQ